MTETPLGLGPFGDVVGGFGLVQGRDGTTLKGRATFAFLQRHCRALRSGDLEMTQICRHCKASCFPVIGGNLATKQSRRADEIATHLSGARNDKR